MKRKITFILSILSVLILGLLIYGYITQTKFITYQGKTYVQKKVDLTYINQLFDNTKLSLSENKKTKNITLKELGISKRLKNEKLSKWSYVLNLDVVDKTYQTDDLNANLDKFNTFRTQNEPAKVELKDGKLTFVKEKQGDFLNIEHLKQDICIAMDDYTFGAISLSDYYYPLGDYKTNSEILKENFDKVQNFQISYTNGYVFNASQFTDYLIVKDNQIILDEAKKDAYTEHIDTLIEKNLIFYDTVGKNWDFTTHNGNAIQVTGGTWGDYFDSDKETQFVMEQFQKLKSAENRIPIMTKDMEDKIPSTYIEISIQDQYLWYYENGTLKSESKVVTGLKNRMDTPTGVYYISEMINGKYLRGPGYVTWVNKWMRITDRGHGLHDATWRSSFGGNIYTYDGSHGCINLPKQFAYSLYDMVQKGCCVVIY